jgi:uncharacterized lipoprotein YddW (UPF0748 family)
VRAALRCSLVVLWVVSACGPSVVARRSPFACSDIVLVARTPEVFRSRADVARVFATAQRAHVTAIALSVKEDEDLPDLPSGRAFYASRVATIAAGYESFDVLAAAIDEGHARGIEVIAWVPQFHDATAIERDPSSTLAMLAPDGSVVPYVGRHGERFVSPASPSARAYERAIAVEIAERYDVDGLALDWVRYDGWASGFEDATREGYVARGGRDPRTIDLSTDNEERRRWGDYRAEIVASHVRELRAAIDRVRPDLSLGAFVLSPEWTDVSQDTRRFASAIDWVAPMAYFQDWHLPASWVWTDLVPAEHERVGDAVDVIPTLDAHRTDAQNQEVLGGLRVQTPYVHRVAWFAFEDWDDALIERTAPLRMCSVE